MINETERFKVSYGVDLHIDYYFSRFGYNDCIELEPDALVPAISHNPGSSLELTHAGIDFLLQVMSS